MCGDRGNTACWKRTKGPAAYESTIEPTIHTKNQLDTYDLHLKGKEGQEPVLAGKENEVV